MTNWLLVMSVCSVIHGNCLPSWEAGVYNSFYDCGKAGSWFNVKIYLKSKIETTEVRKG